MEKIEEIAYKKYVISKTEIQLENATLEEIYTNKLKNDPEGTSHSVQLLFGTKTVVIDNVTVDGYLKVNVNLFALEENENEKEVEPSLEITVIYKGRFVAQPDTNHKEIEEWVDFQITPMLLPYIRTYVTHLTTQMTCGPVVIPTMDVLESLKQNHYSEQSVGDNEDVAREN